ncbi:MAG: Calx-beta domain-containing protein [Patescibacteria group bacterium]|nr:Calx-beta domain-containing protein [Patescibacteria group bacterium]
MKYVRLRKSNNFKKNSISAPKFVAVLIAVLLFSNFPNLPVAEAAVYTFTQTNWSGGATTTIIVHPATSTVFWSSKDAGMIASSNLSLAAVFASTTQTDASALANGFNYNDLSGLNFASTTITTNAEASIILQRQKIATSSIGVGNGQTSDFFSCGLTELGHVYCWGDSFSGQLGNGTVYINSEYAGRVWAGAAASIDKDGSYIANIQSISLGKNHACAVSRAGNPYCWGDGTSGKLGDGAKADRNIPVRVLAGEAINNATDWVSESGTNYLANIAYIEAGENHTCAVSKSGNAYCWGEGGSGRLGRDTTTDGVTPVRIKKGAAVSGDYNGDYLSNIKWISAGDDHTCAVSRAGNPYCWGDNAAGELGNDNTIDSKVPVQVIAGGAVDDEKLNGKLARIQQITAGADFSCAASEAGNLYCWGRNNYGNLGNGSISVYEDTPNRVKEGWAYSVSSDNTGGYLFNIEQVRLSALAFSTCATSRAGNPYCWGNNSDFRVLGNGNSDDQPYPNRIRRGAAVDGDWVTDTGIDYLANMITANVGDSHSCAVSRAGNPYCWGSDNYGQLGNGLGVKSATTPDRVVGSFGKPITFAAPYLASGVYTSGVIEPFPGETVGFTTLNYVSSTNLYASAIGTTVAIDVRAGNTIDEVGAAAWFTVPSSGDISVLGAKRYIQYRAKLFASADGWKTPSLDSVTINYNVYLTSSLISSSYNTIKPYNQIQGFSWDENVPLGSEVIVSLRTAESVSNLNSVAWVNFTNGTAGCSKVSSTVTCSGLAIPISLRDGAYDQFFQYKVTLSGEALAIPFVSGIGVFYIHSTIQFSTASFSGSENSSSPPIYLTLSEPFSGSVTVNLAVSSGTTATIGSDFNIPSTMTIPPGATSFSFLTILNDTIDENDENIYLEITTSTIIGIGSPSSTLFAILDDDNPPNLSISNTSLNEGLSGTPTASLNVSLFQASGKTITVNWQTENGTALAGSDYQAASGTLTFASGETVKSINTLISGDALYENNETFIVRLTASTNAGISNATGTVTILNDDAAPQVKFSASSASGAESILSVPITITLSAQSGLPVSVNYAVTGGSAAAGLDYAFASGTAIIPAGLTSASTTLTVINDSLYESDETVIIGLSSPNGATLGAPSSTTYYILNNDSPPEVFFEFATSTASEGGSAIEVKAKLSTASGLPATMPFALSGTAASAGAYIDFSISPTSTLVIPSGQTSSTISITSFDDILYEGVIPETVIITMGTPTNAATSSLPSRPWVHTVSINENDNPPQVRFVTSSASGSENISPVNIIFTLSSQTNLPVTAYFTSNTSSTAQSGGVDYTLTSTSTTFSAYSTSSAISFTVNNDNIDEFDEIVILTITTSTNAGIGTPSNYTYTILDDDNPPDLSINNTSLNEGNSGYTSVNLSVSLSPASGKVVSVNWQTQDGTALAGSDYQSVSSTLTFNSGETSKTINLQFLGDTLYENNETFYVKLLSPTNANISNATGTVTVVNDDAAPQVKFANASSSESEAINLRIVTVLLSVPSGLPTTIPFTTSGTATAGSDYTVLTASPVTVPALSTSTSISFSVVNDDLYESEEWIDFKLGIPTNAVTSTPDVHRAVLLESKSLPAISIDNIALKEGDSGNKAFIFPITLSHQSVQTITVDWSTQDSTAKVSNNDYQLASGTVIFAPFTTSTSATVWTIGDFTYEENEEFLVTLANNSLNSTLASSTGKGVILNDDFLPLVRFASANSSVNESVATITLPISLTNMTADEVRVDYAVLMGPKTTATGGQDYQFMPGTAVIVPNTTSTTISFNVLEDVIDEDNEIVTIALSNAVNADITSPTEHTLTISDNDTAGIAVSKSALTVAEGGASDSYSIRLESEPLANVTITLVPNVQLSTSPSTLTFTSINWNIPQTVTVTAFDDTMVEGDHTGAIVQTVSSADLKYNVISIPNVTATIADNDLPNISIANVSTLEGNIGTTPFIFQISLSGISNVPVSVSYATEDGSAKMPQDYVATTGIIVFAVGETEKAITVYVNGDTVFESDETFNILLSDAVGSNIINGTGIGTVRNDDQLPIIQFTDSSVSGKESITSFNIPVSLSAISLDQVNVNYLVTGGTASLDTDFVLASGTVSIPAGFNEGEILLRVTDDKIRESDETIEITLVNPVNAVLGVNTKFIYTILDDDILGGVSIEGIRSTIAAVSWISAVEGTSIVEYSATTPTYTSMQVVPGTSLDHKVYLSNLSPATQYFVRVKSVDKDGNEYIDDNNGAGHAFTTTPGPIITAVVPIDVLDTRAAVSWYTDISSNSYVTYSTSSAPEAGIEIGNGTLVAGEIGPYSHKVDLNNLEPSTTYYFKVKSVDAQGNIAEEINNGRYYSFTTTQDVTPPEIINIAAPVITANSVVVFWQTNEPSDSQVEYGTVSGIYNLQTSYNTTLAETHTAVLLNLSPETTYYYRIRSKDILGNIGVSVEQSVKTTAAGSTSVTQVSDEATVAQALYEALRAEYNRAKNGLDALLGAKDTTPPVITDIKADDVKSFSAAISWKTNEPANSYAKYGETADYGLTAGLPDLVENHKLLIKGLKMGTTYHFKVSSADSAGNLTSSEDFTFTTLFAAEDLEELIKVGDISKFQDQLGKIIESVTPSLVPPVISEVTVKNITETGVTITWRTNVEGSSLVAFASEEEYKPKAENPYIAEMGKSEAKTKEHLVELVNLKSGVKYHFQVKTQNVVGVMGKGRDLIFTTKFGKPELIVLEVKETKASVKWATDKPTTSYVELKDVKTNKITKIGDELLNRSHIIALTNLKPDTSYEVKGFGYDEKGNLIETRSKVFKTLIDIKAPTISGLKIENALIPTRTDRLQTIVLWKTDEPATSQVFYEEGVGAPGAKLKERSILIETLTTDHVVVLTSFKPSAVYRIQVVSMDGSGNKAVSSVQSILTPQKGESIFDIITRNFEQSFGWLKFLQQR